MGARHVRLAERSLPYGWLLVSAGLVVVMVFVIVSASGDDLWLRLMLWIQSMQRDLHDRLGFAVRAVNEQGAWAAWSLIGLSFLYGVFHAAGPGHGKVVIATYLLTQESEMRRGVMLSFLAALTQGIVAIVVVEVTVTLLDLPLRGAQKTAAHFETASYAAVALLGAVLVFSASRRLLRRGRNNHKHGTGPGHEHCGHSHGPTPDELKAHASWRKGFAVILSVGLRPCSGAILVLLLAYALHLTWSGMAAVLAMSLGTALMVSALAVLAVYARGFSLQLAERLPDSGRRFAGAIDTIALAGGLIVLALGLSLLHMALTVPAHPLMMGP